LKAGSTRSATIRRLRMASGVGMRPPALGINYFDTAPIYGDGESERSLGRVWKALRPSASAALEASLKRLQMERVDLLQLHNVIDGGHPRGPLLLGQHPRHDLASTPGRRPGILMDVHPGLLPCGDGWSATTSFAAETRMDNLLTVHA
jgi:hypothetical protein